jgi:hypothetical protein
MLTLAQIEHALSQLGRPSMGDENIRVTNFAALSTLRRRQNEWDLAHPDKAAEHRRLLVEAEGINAANEEAQRLLAEKGRIRQWLVEKAGERVAKGLDAPDEREPLKQARAWWATDSWCLAFIGNTGTGKSTGAGWCARESLQAGRWTVWLDARESGTAEVFGEKGRARADRAARAALLVVDDLGAKTTKGVEHWLAWLDGVLTMRHARHDPGVDPRRTIITSNDTPEKFKALVGDRMLDRMREGGVLHAFGGASLRRSA